MKPTAKVFSFDLQFTGRKKTSFYRKLYGFKSKTKKINKDGEEKVYENFYPGLLTPMPHLRLGKSVVAVPMAAAEDLRFFFEDSKWRPIELYIFDAFLPPDDRLEAMEATLDRIKVAPDRTLGEVLRTTEPEVEFVGGVLKAVKRLIELDWSEGRKFSQMLRKKVAPFKGAR